MKSLTIYTVISILLAPFAWACENVEDKSPSLIPTKTTLTALPHTTRPVDGDMVYSTKKGYGKGKSLQGRQKMKTFMGNVNYSSSAGATKKEAFIEGKGLVVENKPHLGILKPRSILVTSPSSPEQIEVTIPDGFTMVSEKVFFSLQERKTFLEGQIIDKDKALKEKDAALQQLEGQFKVLKSAHLESLGENNEMKNNYTKLYQENIQLKELIKVLNTELGSKFSQAEDSISPQEEKPFADEPSDTLINKLKNLFS